MSAAAWTVVGVLVTVTTSLAVVVRRLTERVRRAETRLDAVTGQIAGDLTPALDEARAEARAATVMARRAAGIDDPPPKVPMEPVTGRLIKVVALGAGARRAMVRFGRPDREKRAS